jgi:DNA-directed RNA polymerase specialized sigma24 family protein
VTGDPHVAYTADDAILLNLVRTGETEAYEVLRQRHEQAARRLARCLVPAEEADDLVAEAFAWILAVTLRGGGPADAFRPYLLNALRRVGYEGLPGPGGEDPADSGDMPDPGELFTEPGMADRAPSLIVRTFQSLPDRWIAVLWHTVIEETDPAKVTQILGLSPGAAESLVRRARKGLRQAYLQLLMTDVAAPECQPVARQLGAIVRGTASNYDRAMVTDHLGNCDECRAAYTDLTDLNIALRSQVAPVYLGSTAAAYLPSVEAAVGGIPTSPTAAGKKGPQAGTAGARERAARSRHISRPLLLTAAGAVPLCAVGAALALTLAGEDSPRPASHGQPAQAAAAPTAAGRPGSPAHKPQGKGATPVPSATTRPARSPSAPAGSRPGHTPAPGSHSTAPQPSTTPTPHPSPASPPDLSMAAALNTAQTGTDQLSFGVTNSGGTTTGDLTLSVSLPAGTSLWSGPGAVSSGWSCQSTSVGLTCQGGPVSANTQVHASIIVSVNDLGEACGQRAWLSAVSGSVSASTQTGDGVQCKWG